MTESEPFFFSQPDSKTAASSIQAASAFANSILVGATALPTMKANIHFHVAHQDYFSELLDLFRQIG
jgi:hypothetical protein